MPTKEEKEEILNLVEKASYEPWSLFGREDIASWTEDFWENSENRSKKEWTRLARIMKRWLESYSEFYPE